MAPSWLLPINRFKPVQSYHGKKIKQGTTPKTLDEIEADFLRRKYGFTSAPYELVQLKQTANDKKMIKSLYKFQLQRAQHEQSKHKIKQIEPPRTSLLQKQPVASALKKPKAAVAAQNKDQVQRCIARLVTKEGICGAKCKPGETLCGRHKPKK